MKLAYWGSGPISNFHVPAARDAGFQLEGVFSRPGSTRLREFANIWGLKVVETEDAFLDLVSKCDAVMVSLNTRVTSTAISKLADLDIPVLAEKPGGLTEAELTESTRNYASTDSIFFAYNRRFYPNVQLMRAQIQAEDCAVIAEATWPDSIPTFEQWLINGCHIVDLLRFMFGDLEVLVAERLSAMERGVILLRAENGSLITLSISPKSPANARVSAFVGEKVYELRPLESLSVFDSINIIDPTPDWPVRRYVPNLAEEVFADLSHGKPGFLEQWTAFYAYLETGVKTDAMCGYEDGLASLKLTEEIGNALWRN